MKHLIIIFFSIRLLEVGKILITVSILALVSGVGFGILHILKINKIRIIGKSK